VNPFPELGKLLILLGLALVLLGALLTAGPKLPSYLGWLGRLPGDIRIEGKAGSFYFPLMTCLLVSALLSFLFWLFRR
jgi:hypothetical protein